MLKDFFYEEKIEYFSVIDYKSCIEISAPIIEREEFLPKSVILFLMPYYTGETENISRYAASLDYHIAIREVGERLKSYLLSRFQNAKMRIFGDHSPIAERHAALISGLGIAGDSGLLINEKYGTYVFIGDMITDIPADTLGVTPLVSISTCCHCGACKRSCPTGILRQEGESCLSEITQRKGDLDDYEKMLMKDYNTAWGCDICQTACPHNINPIKTPLEFFYRDCIYSMTRTTLDSMSKDQFKQRAFSWRGRKTIERNLDILSEKRQ